MSKSAKKRAKIAGRPRDSGRERYASGRVKACNTSDSGTTELAARKMKLTKSKEYPTTPLGILAGRGLVSDVEYAAAIDFRELFVANCGQIWPRAAALERAPVGYNPSTDTAPKPSVAQAERYRYVVGVLEGRALERLSFLVLHEADFDSIIEEVLDHDINSSNPAPPGLAIRLGVLRNNLQAVANAPRGK